MKSSSFSPIGLLHWYLDIGVDETISNSPRNHYDRILPENSLQKDLISTVCAGSQDKHLISINHNEPERMETIKITTTPFLRESFRKTANMITAELAAECTTLADLRAAMASFDGCSLKKTAINLVFSDGIPSSPVMIVGEAPGAEEDRQGLPFVGPSGRLLDKMLASIDLDRRRNCYITNVIPWRPPDNRKPLLSEITVFLPFLTRHIALISPKILLLVGGLAVSAVLERKEGITRLRGQWLEYTTGLSHAIPVLSIFHPAYLLRMPIQKRLAWRDLLTVKQRLATLTVHRIF